MLVFLLAQATPALPPVTELEFPTVEVDAKADGATLVPVRARAPARFTSTVTLRANFDAEIIKSTDEVPR
jgi:hypothetical protein